jgi:hypothetical protein
MKEETPTSTPAVQYRAVQQELVYLLGIIYIKICELEVTTVANGGDDDASVAFGSGESNTEVYGMAWYSLG